MAKKEFTGVNVTTPICRLAFPALFEPVADLNDKMHYSVTMLFDKASTDINLLKKALIQAARNEFGPDVDLKTINMKRIIDGDTKNDKGEDRRSEYKGCWVIRAKTAIGKPGVVDGKLNAILDPSEIYSGVYAKVNITAKSYKAPSRGVTFYLNHVQKVKDGEPFAGGPKTTDVFQALDIDPTDVEATVSDEIDGLFQ